MSIDNIGTPNHDPDIDPTHTPDPESDAPELTTKERVRHMETKLFQRCTALNAAAGLSREMTNSLKRLLKRAKRTRDRGSDEEVAGVEKQLERMIQKVEAELKSAEIEIPEIDRDIPGGAQPRPRRTRKPTADEMAAERKRRIDRKLRVCIAMEQGKSAREALESLGIEDRTPRWARKTYARYQRSGMDGLKDGRVLNGRNENVMTQGIKDRTLRLWVDSPAAGPKAVWTDLKEDLDEALEKGELPSDTRVPSYSSVQRFLNDQPKVMKLVRDGRFDRYENEGRSVIALNWTTHANQRWQADTNQPKVWARRILPNGESVPSRFHMPACIDVHSRAIPAFLTRFEAPTAATIRKLYLKGVLPGEEEAGIHGIPEIIQTDNGGDYISQEVTVALAELGVQMDIDPPEYPQRKGIIERFFRTLDEGLLRRLPGHHSVVGKTVEAAMNHIDDLMTLDQITTEIAHWIEETYHQRVHSRTKQRPAVRWTRTVRIREAESLDELIPLWVNSNETRVVCPEGIRMTLDGEQLRFWAPFLDGRGQEEVRIGFNREDRSRVMVYSIVTGERLGWAFNPQHEENPYDFTDVIRARDRTEGTLRTRITRYQRLNDKEARRRHAEDPTATEELRAELEGEPDNEGKTDEPTEAERLEAELLDELGSLDDLEDV